ncbi:MAG: SUMF1/EgtB/PvdO family nonheme iron enzyme [Verrucomicrobiales bacterium]
MAAARSFLATAPEAEVHSAAEWLLRAWGERIDPLVPRSGPSPPPAAGAPGWETDPATGIAFATFAGPIEFQMGSPEAEPWRTDMEFLHRAEIPYSFAIATKTLTKNQAVSLLPDDFLHLMEGADSELPVREFTLFAARRLCNAASKIAGLPEDQWCYTAGAEPAPKENLESLGGYRFPTEAEWEYACRGGSSAPRPYGYSERLLPNYACISDYGGGMRPPGTKMPNGFGMFEMLGGVQNLVEGVFERYEGDPKPKLGKSLIAEILLPGEMAAPPSSALVRGLWETMPANLFRSAYRDRSIYPSKARLHLTSIRLARTIL